MYEKETRLKEIMRIMGLKNSVHWIATFITSFTIFFASSLMLAIILKFGNIFKYADFFLILFCCFSFIFPTICFCFLMSTFFSNANLAAAVAAIVFFVTYLPFVTYQAFAASLTSLAAKLLMSLLSNVCFGFICMYILGYELQGIGASWSTVGREITEKVK